MSNPIRDEISYAILKIRSPVFSFIPWLHIVHIVAKKKEEKKLDKPKSSISETKHLLKTKSST